MKRNFTIELDTGSGYSFIDDTAVKDVAPADFTREKEQMYYRIKIGEVSFQNIPGSKIYSIIDAVDFETEMKIRLTYHDLVIEGYFAKIDCSYDNDKNGKIIKVTPAVDDQYRRFLENYETEIDVTDNDWEYEEETAAHLTSSTLQTYAFWDGVGSYANGYYAKKELRDHASNYDKDTWDSIGGTTGFFNEDGSPMLGRMITAPYNATDNFGQNIQNLIDAKSLSEWELSEVTVWRGNSRGWPKKRTFYVTCKFSKETVFMETSDGTQTGTKINPPGEGWIPSGESPILDYRNLGVYGYWFNRKPFNGAYGLDKLNKWTQSEKEYNTGTGGTVGFTWTEQITTKIIYPLSDEEGEEDSGEYKINVLTSLKNMLTFMYQNLHTELATKEVKSLFLFNDDEGDYSFMSGILGGNYVTNLPNELNYLKCFHTSSLKTEVNEDSEDEDSHLSISLKKVIEDLQKYFPVYIFIDDDKNLHIEHIKYFELIKSTHDISDKKELENTYQFSYDNSSLFDEKIFGQNNAGYLDFNNNSLKFAQAVSNNRNKDNKNEQTTEIFTTDLRYCLENPNDLENGLVLILSKNGEVLNGNGYIAGTEQMNGALCFSQLLVKYWRYEGVWTTGLINDTEYQFMNALRSKIGIELSFRGIDPNLYFTTQIGVGLIDEGSLDFDNESTKVKLRYRYSGGAGDGNALLAYTDDGVYNLGNSII